MYNDIKLEKGLYNLSGKCFSEALEELDPSAGYIGTPLENLDAYERQHFLLSMLSSVSSRDSTSESTVQTATELKNSSLLPKLLCFSLSSFHAALRRDLMTLCLQLSPLLKLSVRAASTSAVYLTTPHSTAILLRHIHFLRLL